MQQATIAARGFHVRERAFKNFFALLQHGDARAELLHFVQQMRRQQNGQAEFAVQPQNGLAHFVDAFGVKAVARLVENQQFRLGQQRLRQREPRAHPVRIRPHLGLLAARQADPFDDFADARVGSRRGVGAQDFQIPPAAQVIVKNGRLKNRADLFQRRRGGWSTSWPQTLTSPPVGQTWPSIMPMAVLLPAPLWPSRPKISPRGTVNERSSTATRPPNFLLDVAEFDHLVSRRWSAGF